MTGVFVQLNPCSLFAWYVGTTKVSVWINMSFIFFHM